MQRLDEPRDEVLLFIMKALGKTGDPAAVDRLAAIAAPSSQRSHVVRTAATRTLGVIRHHSAIGALGQALSDRSARVRRDAVWGLSRLDVASAQDLLRHYARWRYPVTTVRARRGARRHLPEATR